MRWHGYTRLDGTEWPHNAGKAPNAPYEYNSGEKYQKCVLSMGLPCNVNCNALLCGTCIDHVFFGATNPDLMKNDLFITALRTYWRRCGYAFPLRLRQATGRTLKWCFGQHAGEHLSEYQSLPSIHEGRLSGRS